ncbi:MAG: protein kinase [Acidobacteriota bacterium]|nr:protein kinase [Acidobacteriota bacterium]
MLSPGTKLGPYEVVAPIGAGGMGEVYRARDTRLGRDVAAKVLPASFSSDPERLRRFEQEARAVAALNHPNILAIHDIGTHDGAPFLVTELLEGETLRERLAEGALPVRKTIEIAVQAAHGVAAAHEKGIVHRDLKPANIFLTSDGRVKILDFGLAKLTERESKAPGETQGVTLTAGGATEPGVVLGTVGYMSPEQVRGKPADARSDIFALGAILYEMLSGERAFQKNTSAETMTAILKEEPPELAGEGKKIPPALERIVRHCLEKNPGERFQSTRDLAFNLESLSGASTASTPALASGRRVSRRWLLVLLAVLVALAAGAATERLLRRTGTSAADISYRPMDLQPEAIFNARFGPDGATVVYSAAVEGNKPELMIKRPDAPAAQPMGLADTQLLSVSSRGELAVLTGARYYSNWFFAGTLAEMPLEGGAPRDLLGNVQDAGWSPDGSGLAIIREVKGESRLEYPIGHVLYQTAGYVSGLRFSPDGKEIAFFDHPSRYDDRGRVAVVDLEGHARALSSVYVSLEGLAWARSGNEFFFSGAPRDGSSLTVYAVNLSGQVSKVLGDVGDVRVLDVSRDGSLLLAQDGQVSQIMALPPGADRESNLSWLNFSNMPIISADGETLLFTEASVGEEYGLCLRKTDGSPVVRLGDGNAQDLSRDGAWALSIVPSSPMQLVVYPTGAGEKRVLERGKIESYESAQFFADGKRVLFCGNEPGRATRCYVQALAGGPARAVTPEGTSAGLVSPSGDKVLVQNTEGQYLIYPLGGGSPRPVTWLMASDVVIRWSLDGSSVLVYQAAHAPTRVERVDISTGRRSLIKVIGPTDLTGVVSIWAVSMSDHEKSYAYSFVRILSHLAVVQGVK